MAAQLGMHTLRLAKAEIDAVDVRGSQGLLTIRAAGVVRWAAETEAKVSPARMTYCALQTVKVHHMRWFSVA